MGEIIKRSIVAAVIAICIVAATANFLVLRRPSFTTSGSPSTVIMPQGGTENLTVSYGPKPPSNLSMGTGISGLIIGGQFGGRASPPFTFSIVVLKNAVLRPYTVMLEAPEMDAGIKTTATILVGYQFFYLELNVHCFSLAFVVTSSPTSDISPITAVHLF